MMERSAAGLEPNSYGARETGPLTGVRIVDLTRLMSGPWATVMLADLGAEVIKVEPAGVGDLFRHMGGYNRGGTNGIFMGLNRGKRSIALDLTQPEARDIVRTSAADADVVIENFRPGALARLGLAPAELHRMKPDLIIVSITGFGTEGPSADEPAYDTVIQGRSGISSRQKRDADAEPDSVRSFISDKLGGFFGAQSILAALAALVARSQGATGQTIEVSLLDASMYYAWPDVTQEIAFVGEATPGMIFAFQPMMWRTLDGHVVYTIVSLEDRHRLAAALDRHDLIDDPRFATLAAAVSPSNFAQFGEEMALVLATVTTGGSFTNERRRGAGCCRCGTGRHLEQPPRRGDQIHPNGRPPNRKGGSSSVVPGAVQ